MRFETTEKDRDMLLVLRRGKNESARLTHRSAIVLLAADGWKNIAISAHLNITRQSGVRWWDE